ncbi:hypothetical protein NP233_g9663 [Leucocoprinus birnbaumii]|uniref:Uncharacterized protein n=1 Tax=Leucocoprinus birnbaumii TaxID=56174 RepID=A0AAD5VQJ0_9AGAR|nr:hypothetical protein NP233_g9663 [Leucocoprinus birnbaumii]
MSDEYASSGYRGSLANETIGGQIPKDREDKDKSIGVQTDVANYPQEGDCLNNPGNIVNMQQPRQEASAPRQTSIRHEHSEDMQNQPEQVNSVPPKLQTNCDPKTEEVSER